MNEPEATRLSLRFTIVREGLGASRLPFGASRS
jgi:hypothetical protein